MEKLHKDILIRLRKNVIDDLDVDNDIIQPLRNEYILTEDHIKNIYIGATKEERAAKLLDILPLYQRQQAALEAAKMIPSDAAH
ncbi:hypothetical protein ALC57_12403 [Trachymyrmex cornetzi]|uniref:CARD domain-containing protein n=1 Tax=Trachymyrmex cornetzi TaxID=471704 RepID=A0A195DS58_9HYME|nr:hypothetical protein ALC57_12403 [Trachymyrmex cornetzi]